MKHFYGLKNITLNDPCNVAFGSFDGVHKGHTTLINKLTSLDGQSVVISFEDNANPILTTEAEKEYLLDGMGADVMVSVPSGTYSESNPDTFISDIKTSFPGISSFVVSESFKTDLGMNTISVPEYSVNGKALTTDYLKDILMTHSFEFFLELLGHPYILSGTIVHGQGNGSKFNMPTANLQVADNKILPPYGVYGSVSCIKEGPFWSATNIGTRPSVDSEKKITVESFLPDYHGPDFYDEYSVLKLYCFVRGIQKFSGLDEVKLQVDKDQKYILNYLSEHVKMS